MTPKWSGSTPRRSWERKCRRSIVPGGYGATSDGEDVTRRGGGAWRTRFLRVRQTRRPRAVCLETRAAIQRRRNYAQSGWRVMMTRVMWVIVVFDTRGMAVCQCWCKCWHSYSSSQEHYYRENWKYYVVSRSSHLHNRNWNRTSKT